MVENSTSTWNLSNNDFTDFTYNDTLWDDLKTNNYPVPSYTIVALVLSVSSLLLNILSLLAILNAPGRSSAQLRLAGSLTMADAVIALSVFLHSIIRSVSRGSIVSDPNRTLSSCTIVFSFALNVSGHLICLFNLLAMGLDHYIAILLPLRYASIVTKRRTRYVIIGFWILALFGGFSVFFSALHAYTNSGHRDYCEAAVHNDYYSEYLVFAVAAVSLFVLSFTYVSVLLEVKRTHRRGACSDRDRKNRKTLWTTLLILGTFVFLWGPSCAFNVTMVFLVARKPDAVRNSFLILLQVGQYLYCLMLFNCLADPIIYAIRVPDVKLGYKMMFWKVKFALQKWCRPEGTHSGLTIRTRWSQQFSHPLLPRRSLQRSQSVQTNVDDSTPI